MNALMKIGRLALLAIVGLPILYIGVGFILTQLPEPKFENKVDVGPIPIQSKDTTGTAVEFMMRDGETLSARQFEGSPKSIILLLHGVTADSRNLVRSSQQLRETTGSTVYALDLRGHGRSGGIAGDVDYIGQYEDDVADVIESIRTDQPNSQLILAGHSMGGGIALRFAQLTERPEVDGYLLFAPHLGTNAPTMPPSNPETAELAAAYTQLHLPRLIGLIMLNSVGIKGLNHLDTLFFNLPDGITHTYSFGATVNSSPQDHGPALSAVEAPLLVLVGSQDEAFVADQFPVAVSEFSNGEVQIIEGANHNSILENAIAMDEIQGWMAEVEPIVQ